MSSKVKAQSKRSHGGRIVKRSQTRQQRSSQVRAVWRSAYDGYGGYAGQTNDCPPEEYKGYWLIKVG